MARLRLVLAYDGTCYQGWQTQKVGQGVQERVESALRALFPAAGAVHSSSRTDTGVHARGLVAHVDIPVEQWRMSSRKLVLALNAHLPADIRLMSASRTRSDFHARFGAVSKEYRYCVWNAPALDPLLRHQAWHVPRSLAVIPMQQAARRLVGCHDFATFTSNPGYARANTVRTLFRCEVRQRGSLLTFVIEGSGFLYKMCRGIVGTLVQVGLARIAPEDIPRLLACRDRRVAGATAPPQGLVLWQVRYGRRRERAQSVSTSEEIE
jgi:tRNA pseudouridine38-40 synthase